ncbi:MAG: O-antigen ligase family protein [bacterium]|nr:O-antigen ligase family protein [bacterium]
MGRDWWERHRLWLVGLVVVLLPFQFRTALPFRLAPADLVLACCLALGFRHLRFPPSAWSPWHRGLPLVFGMGLVVALMRTGEVIPYALWQKGAGLLVLLALYAVVVDVAVDWATVRRLLLLFVLGTVFANLVAMTGFLASLAGGLGNRRLAGFLVDPNAHGSLLVVALSIQLLTWLSSRRLVRGVPGVLCMVTLGAGLLLTISRSAWAGALVAVAVGAIIDPRLLLIAGLIASPAALALACTPGYLQLVMARLPLILDRVEIVEEAAAQIALNPMFGAGLGVFHATSRVGKIVHNTLLWSLTEFGLIGLAVFCGFLGWFVVAALRAAKRAPGAERELVLAMAAAHLAMLAVSMGIEALYQRHWWLVMALIGASHTLASSPRAAPGGSSPPS